MKLSKTQFEELLEKNRLRLSLIGMSNIGKTHWSGKLAQLDFKHFNCDDLIEIKLAPLLKKLGYSGIKDVSRWMGQPYDKRFPINQKKYLGFEQKVVESISSKIKNFKKGNIVVDTTGSIVHLKRKVFSDLSKNTLIVYIKATNSMGEKMFKRYIQDPKPVVFGDVFTQKRGELKQDALKRCYLKLLNRRSKLYYKYADIVLSCRSIGKNADGEKLISLIKEKL